MTCFPVALSFVREINLFSTLQIQCYGTIPYSVIGELNMFFPSVEVQGFPFLTLLLRFYGYYLEV